MKKRIKEFIEYYKELGFSKIFWYLLSIAYYIFDMWYMWNGESYIGFIKKYHNAFFEKPLDFLYPCVYPIVIAIVILLEFLFKKVNKLSIILNYVLITVLFAFDFFMNFLFLHKFKRWLLWNIQKIFVFSLSK